MTDRRYVLALAALGGLAATGAGAQSPRTTGLVTQGVATIRDLKSLTGETAQLALVAGYHAAGDGGGGLFLWDGKAQEPADEGLLFAGPRAGQPGRWRRLFEGPIDVRMFGAKGDGKIDDSAALQAAIDASVGSEVHIPAGTFILTRTLRFRAPKDRHSAGLKLTGEGSWRTVIDCRITDGPALSIEQEKGYDFGMHGLLRDLDFKGEFAPPGKDQHGIVMSGAWIYRLDRVAIRQFRGSAVVFPFVADRGVRYRDVMVEAGSDIVRRDAGEFKNSLNYGEVVIGDGIAPETYVEALIDERTVRLSRPAVTSGTVTLNIWGKNFDGQTSIVTLHDCRLTWNGGWGLDSQAGAGVELVLRETQIGNNRRGGLHSGGVVVWHGGTCTANGTDDGKGVGILLDVSHKRHAERAVIDGVEIDGNREVNLWLRHARFVRISRNRFNAVEVEKAGRQLPLAAIRIGDSDGHGVETGVFELNQIRVDGIHLWHHVGFEIPDGAYADNIVVKDTMFWGGWSDAHHTRYRIGRTVNPYANIRFEDGGRPAVGRPVPASYIARLDGAAGRVVAPGEAAVLRLEVVATSAPDLIRHRPVAGGVQLPFDAFYAAELSVTASGNGALQPVTLGLLAEGKAAETRNLALPATLRPQSLDLSATNRWPAGTSLHAIVKNESAAPLTLERAVLTVRLLS